MTEKKKNSRLYRFQDKLTGDVVFVRATTFAQGLNYWTRDRFSGRVAAPEDTLGVAPKEVLDATRADVHPDQQPLDGV